MNNIKRTSRGSKTLKQLEKDYIKAQQNKQYYHIRHLFTLHPEAIYYLIFGKRSNGKTYSALEWALEEYMKGNGAGAYIRRFDEDLKGSAGFELFKGLIANEQIRYLTHDKYNGVKYEGRRAFLIYRNEEGEIETQDSNPFMYFFALSMQEHYKSFQYPDIKRTIFDEFITNKLYLADEFREYQNLLSTIIRDRDDVVNVLLGNTISKYNPYFGEMGLNHIKEMAIGDTAVYKYGESGLVVAVEYAGVNLEKGKGKHLKSDKYFAWDNPAMKMITQGSWELDVYPHLPMKYEQKDVMYKFYVEFDGELLQGNFIHKEGCDFIYFHRKTSEIKAKPYELVYTTKQDPRPNYRMRITIPKTDTERTIVSMFQKNKVFYQSNDVGDLMRNYIAWCGKQ